MLQNEDLLMGHPLRVLRTQMDLSQKDFADKVGVSEATISRAESGHRISFKVRRQFCDRLGKTSEELGLMGRTREVIRPTATPPSVQDISLPATSTSIQSRQKTRVSNISFTDLSVRHAKVAAFPVEQPQEPAWLTLGASYLGQLFNAEWSTDEIVNTLKIVLQGVEGMPASTRNNLLWSRSGTLTESTPFFTSVSISEEDRVKLHSTLGESIASSWKLFLSTNSTQILAIGQALLFLIQRNSTILYPTVLPLYYSPAYRLIGAALFFQARYAEALQAHEQAYITALQANDAWNMAESLAWQANVWQACGKYHVSIQLIEQALRLANFRNDSRSYAIQAKLLAQWAENAALLHESNIAMEKLNASATLLACIEPNDEFDNSIWHYYRGTCALYLNDAIQADASFQLALQGHHPNWKLQNTNTTLLQAKARLKKEKLEGSLQVARRAFSLVLSLDSPLLSLGFIDFLEMLQNQFSGNQEVKHFAEEVERQLTLPIHTHISRYLEAELV